ncbi:MAG: hypothetical protein N3H31_04740 [Candidatus Nezhaarchaeota archaeon]|nr:hypothetical protein [Candidatus Nezhaarchaeota archaeon]
MSEDPFERILQRYLEAVKSMGGRASFNAIVEWASREELGSSIVAAVVLNELVARGLLRAPEGLMEVEGLQDLKAPVVVELPAAQPASLAKDAAVAAKPPPVEEVVEEDLKAAASYLSEYWSVGEIRFLDDLRLMGVKDPQRVLRRLLELGYVERTSSGVINATSKLPRVKRRAPSLADFI